MQQNAETEADRTTGVEPPVQPMAPWRLCQIRIVEHGVFEARFADGTSGTVDMRPLLERHEVEATVFGPLRDPAIFSAASVHLGAVVWPGDIDLAPDAMYDAIRAEGKWLLE